MELSRPGADLFGTTEAAILLALARLTEGASGREVARLIGASAHTTARRALEKLVRIGIVEAKPSSHAVLYSLNRAHVLWEPIFEVLASPAKIEQKIGEIVSSLPSGSVSAVVFGSVARQESTSDSDIDVGLVFADHIEPVTREGLNDRLHDELGPYTGNDVQVIVLTRSQFRSMVRDEDPLIASWSNEAHTIVGPDLAEVIAEAW